MSAKPFRAALVSLLAAVFSIPLFAAEPWDAPPLTADPKAMLAAAEKVSPGDSDAVVILEEIRYSFDEKGRATTTEHLIFRLVDDSAVEDWSTIEALWAPWYQEKPQIEARVITKDGVVHRLDAKALIEAPAPEESLDIFSDNRVFRAPLPAMAGGVVVEQLITYKDRNPLYEAGTTGRFHFGRWVPVHASRLVLEAPANLPLRIVNKTKPELQPKRTEKDGRVTMIFEAGRLEPLEDLEWNLPFDESSIDYIAFSSGQSWQELARRYSEIVEQQIANPELQKFTREAVGNAKDRKEIVDRALAAIQKNVRYAGVEVGEGSIVPRKPKTVLDLRYGDCKDKAALLVAMLREVGITAHVALLRAGSDLDIHRDLPGLGQFNHAIVLVEGTETAAPIWVDPTDEYSPAGSLPVMDQGRLALVASPKTTEVTLTPTVESSANLTIETRTFTLSEEGKARVVEITESTGADDASQRRYAADTDKKEYRESMESYAKAQYAAEKMSRIDSGNPRDLSKPFRITIEVEEAARGTTAESDAAVAIFPSGLIESVPWSLRYDEEEEAEGEEAKKEKKRVRDFVFTMPYVKEWRYRIVPPPGFVARTLPQNETKKLGTTTLKTEYSSEADGTVVATYRFDSGKRRITAAEYEETRKALAELEDSEALIIGFDNIGWAKLNDGDVAAGLAEFRRMAALHPKEARHHVQIARAFLIGGMGEAARNEIKRAISIEPMYAPAHRIQGMILQHDLLGREFRKGFDLKGALAAYRRAKVLDSKDVDTRAELAKLLERTEEGMRFGDGAPLAEAIAEYDALIKELEQDQYEGELLLALAHAGKFEELKKRAREVKDEEQKMLGLVIGIAATDGPAAAIREASSVNQQARREALGGAVQTLMALRMYPEAAALLEATMHGSPNAAQARPLLEALKKAKRIETVQLDPKDPKSVVLGLMFAFVRNPDDEKELLQYVARYLHELDQRQADTDAKNPARAGNVLSRTEKYGLARATMKQSGMSMVALFDLGFASMDLLTDGDDKNGYRVRMRAAAGVANNANEAFYVIKEGDRYVIGGVKSAPGALGFSALHMARNGNLDGARIWLNWAREDTSAGGLDDPLLGSTFAALWPKGKQTATLEEVTAAAAALMQEEEDYRGEAQKLLVEVREKMPEASRKWVDAALVEIYERERDWKSAATLARRLAEAFPESAHGFMTLARALVESGSASDAKQLADARLEKLPKDGDALRALAMISSKAGDYETTSRYYRQIIDESSSPSSWDYNNIAWNALFVGGDLEKAVADARQATMLPGGGAPALHTLAALYAETGKSLEAREALLKSMDSAGREEPADYDWYVLGRIAENYGAHDAAIAAYKRVEKPERASTDSTYLLAQRRLQAIGKR